MKKILLVLFALVASCVAAQAMSVSSEPTPFNIPWAFSASCGTTYTSNCFSAPVQQNSQIGIVNCAASLTDGFPPLTFVPVTQGGCGPWGQDLNGILKQITQWAQWQAAGAPVFYNGAFSSQIGGYPNGALLAQAAKPYCSWISQIDNNASDPDTGGANWAGICPNTIDAAGGTAVTNGTSHNCLYVTTSNKIGNEPCVVNVYVQTFTNSGTYTPHVGLINADVMCVGGGGAGGGAPSTTSNQVNAGAGGGAGGFAEGIFTASTIGSSQSVTIGAGGTGVSGSSGNSGGATTFGALLTANGGQGGAAGVSTSSSTIVGGAGGGTGSGGYLNIPGQTGYDGWAFTASSTVGISQGAAGGSSFFAGGGTVAMVTNISGSLPGIAGAGPGAAGGGASASPNSTAQPGGSGIAGICKITEFASQ